MKCLRILTGLNQEQFAEKHEIAYTTIRNWEYGRVIPRKNGILDFIASIKKHGVFAECDWILFGIGVGPSFDLKNPMASPILINDENIEVFKQKNKSLGLNPIVTSIIDNSMAPWFCVGDLVGGVLIDAAEFKDTIRTKLNNGKFPVLIRLADGNYVPRWPKVLGEELVFLSNTESLDKVNTISVALISWHEVKYPRS
jgi:transcriptional regulator with XRE-family HTH domain